MAAKDKKGAERSTETPLEKLQREPQPEVPAVGAGASTLPVGAPPPILARPPRARLPSERLGVNKKFRIPSKDGEMRIYVTTGCYPDGRLGEVFIKADKVGTFASGALDAAAMAISVGLQHGVPLAVYTDKLVGMSFEPSGFTGDPEFQQCRSVLDLVGRWLRARYEPKP